VFIVQVGTRSAVFFEYNTIVEVNRKFTDEIPFPAVTLCNQNNFRFVLYAKKTHVVEPTTLLHDNYGMDDKIIIWRQIMPCSK
jgi:hypothetical protein